MRKSYVIFLAALVVGLGALAAYQWWGPSGTPGGSPTASRPASPPLRPQGATTPHAVPTVRLDALAADRSEAEPQQPAGRNLFQFQPKLPPPPPMPVRPAGPAPGEVVVPPPPPPPPPIPVKFIGIVQAPDKKLAVLTDVSTKDVFYGREGDIIDGRYRILRIGVESIEMAYVDGRGRQTIRLTGS